MDGAFPVGLAKETNLRDGGIALGPFWSDMQDGALAGRREQLAPVAPSCGVAHLAVVSAIADESHPRDRRRDRENVSQSLTVVSLARCDDAAGIRHPRLLSPRAWINTQVALVKAGLIPDLQRGHSASPRLQVIPGAVAPLQASS